MKLYSYVLRYDRGFAPNPFYGYCTLACCKPEIRKIAKEGDWIVGTGSVENVGNDRLIYAMKVTTKPPLTYEEYSDKFRDKIPSHGLIEERGDNIYFKNQNGEWVQRCPSYHSNGNEENIEQKKKDLKGEFVLISDYFIYFGKEARKIPENFKEIIKKGPKFKSDFSEDLMVKFLEWLEKLPKGKQGDPFLFRVAMLLRVGIDRGTDGALGPIFEDGLSSIFQFQKEIKNPKKIGLIRIL